jgi:hypothetical protein
MTGLIERQVVPRSPGAQHPEYAVQKGSSIFPGPPPTVGNAVWVGTAAWELPIGYRLGPCIWFRPKRPQIQ